MKIALIGYGKMGRTIERLALERGLEIGCVIDVDNIDAFDSEVFMQCDAAIEFTTPATGFDNVARCLRRGVPVVSGTTGWQARLPEAMDLCRELNGSLIWASNFSVGVNIFMAVNRQLARIMNAFPQYTPSMTETHHIHKLDHPSGTAVTLAEQIIDGTGRISAWAEPEEGKTVEPGVLPIDHVREGEVPGIHTIRWDSPSDIISITHSAKNRDGFALGAILAAEWLVNHPGIHTIQEMLSDISGYDFN